MEIVYCGGCGRVLREDDFSKGRARMLDHRPWCSDCQPPDRKPIPAPPSAPATPRASGSSAKYPRIAPGTARREAAAPSRRGLLIGAALAGVALVSAYLLQPSARPTPAPAPAPVPRRIPDPSPPPPSAQAERLLKDLETFASLSPPDRVLARCQELRDALRGTPQEARLRAIEADALRAKEARSGEESLVRELDLLRALEENDPRFEHYDEVIRRYKAAREIAGARAGELDRRRLAYEKSREQSPHLHHAGPFSPDDQGFIRNWLILGPFPSEQGKGFDTDFLGGEGTADPVAGAAVGSRRWAAYASPESKIDFYKVPHLGLRKPANNIVAYAACLIQVPSEVAAEFRVGSDDGSALWVYGTSVGRVRTARMNLPDTDRYAVPLPAGVHRVLLKVENLSADYEFMLRVVTPDGRPIAGLRVWN